MASEVVGGDSLAHSDRQRCQEWPQFIGNKGRAGIRGDWDKMAEPKLAF
jgi:hypothetical protein